jgi:lysozyme family protein
MANVPLTETLHIEYEFLFNSCIIRPEKAAEVERIINNILTNTNSYKNIEDILGIPWSFVAVIHYMEASLDFSCHLHNGDPLTNRTVQVPAGRPKNGKPPFSWIESACDALSMKKLRNETDWSFAGTLYQLERYNGWGYRLYHQHVLSPYLWSFSEHYRSGKYIFDGTWSDTVVSKQCGAAVLLRRMAEIGLFEFSDQPAPQTNTPPLVVNYSEEKPENPIMIKLAEDLQRWLNTFPGIFVKIDGWPGVRTSEAYLKVTGKYLPGDPRA